MNFKNVQNLLGFLKTRAVVGKRGKITRATLRQLKKDLMSSKNCQYGIGDGAYYDVIKLKVGQKILVVKIVERLYEGCHQVVPSKRNAFAKKYYLFPIWHSNDNRIIVQPWATLLPARLNKKQKAMVSQLHKDIDKYEPEPFSDDMHEGNYGLYQGRLKVIDYGHENW